MNLKRLILKQISPILGVFIIVLMAFSTSCNPNEDKNDNKSINIDTITDFSQDKIDEAFDKAVIVFYSLPSPVETARIFKRAGARYDDKILNPPENYVKYSTSRDMALNLGIYSADLSYASMYDQTQATVNYMAVSKKIADELGVLDAINDSIINVLKENVNNRDVIMGIISETFMNSNAYLKENNRPEVATMMVIGGWIEGLYISTKLTDKKTDNKDLVYTIIEQRLSLEDLINLLTVYQENKDIEELLSHINGLKDIYDKLAEQSEQGNDKQEVDPEIYKQLCEKVEEIRNNYTK